MINIEDEIYETISNLEGILELWSKYFLSSSKINTKIKYYGIDIKMTSDILRKFNKELWSKKKFRKKFTSEPTELNWLTKEILKNRTVTELKEIAKLYDIPLKGYRAVHKRDLVDYVYKNLKGG